MRISISMNRTESEMVKRYAELYGKTVSEVMREAILEKIEDAFDMSIGENAMKAYEGNRKTYTIEEDKSILNLK